MTLQSFRFTSVLAAALLAVRALSADSTVVFNEIQYHPAVDEARLEWVELYNQMAVDMDISNWSLGNGIIYLFPERTVVPGGGFLVVAIDPAAMEAETGYSGAHGPFIGRLDNSGDRLELYNNSGRLMDSVRYRDSGDWPVGADGSGATLAKLDPDSASAPAENWTLSARVGGTPGDHNFPREQSTGGFPTGLVSYWNFDEASGQALDPAGGNHGTLGAGALRGGGIIGARALSFDNSISAYVNVGSGAGNNFSTSTGITVEALVRPQWSGSLGDHDQIFRKEDGPDRVLLAFQNDGNGNGFTDPPLAPGYTGPVLSFGLNVGGVYKELDMPLDGQAGRPTLAALKDGAAHHIAAVYSSASGVKAIYVDGALAYSTQLAAGDRISSGGATSAYIGNMSGRGEPFTGVIDEVAFWSRALSAAEIAAHHSAFQEGRNYFEVEAAGPSAAALAINEIYALPGSPGWIEIVNGGGSSIQLQGRVLASSQGAGRQYVFPAQNLGPGAHAVLDEAKLGFSLLPGDKLFLFNADRSVVLDAVEVEPNHRGRHPEATGPWRFPDQPTPAAANRFSFRSEIVINEIMYHHRPEPESPAETVEATFLPIDAEWRYIDTGADPGPTWTGLGFNDAAWKRGRALLYNESAALPAPKNTEIPLGPITYYFRAQFQFNGNPASANLNLRMVIDDGAVFYLNGAEVYRFNVDPGPVTPGTLASPGVGDAAFNGPVPISSAGLVQGTNVLAVEVHQASAGSSDVVFGAELLGITVIEEAKPFRDSPEAWIELYNRGSAAVDLGGWRFDQGVDYLIESGTILGAGEYLVIAADRDYLRSLYPGIRILGNFEGRLSHKEDSLVLLDARGNPADAVHYFDGGRWPEYADGGGSSLELRNPFADNSKAEAWAASDESGKSSWQEVRYRAVASQVVGPNQWSEFVLGLLDNGEALLDDIRVVESPSGAPIDLIQNGTFASGSGAWRLVGNHRHSRVVSDPDAPANRVLQLVATGSTEHMSNHAETTLAGGRAPANGREYEVSMRARWLAGSNQLHTRLYFNRVPRTTLLDVPELNGTPGARNSRFEANIGPTFSDFRHSPVVPGAGQEVEVAVTAADPDGVGAVTLWRSVNGGAWASAAMAPSGGGEYRATIPGQATAATVQFYVEAVDGRGVSATFPARGRDSRALYKVQDGQARPGRLHNIRIVMTPADISFLHLDTNVMSNDLMGATVVYNEAVAFYDVGVRLKGSERGRPVSGRVSFVLRFHPDRLFRGVHESVSIDRSGGWKFGGPNLQDEIIVKHVVQHAGGMPGMYDDLCRVIAPRNSETSSALLMMAKYGDVFLDSQWPNGSDGTTFKLELIYFPTTTDNGSPEGLKRPQPDQVIGTDLQDLGDDKEAYRWNFLIENNRARDDYSNMIRFLKTMSLSGAALEAAAPEVMDVDEWMRIFAVYSLTGIGDTYLFGLQHNNMHYVRPTDGKVLVFMWDADFAFVRATNGSFYDGGNLGKVIQIPAFQRLFFGHLRDIITTTYNTNYMSYWTNHYGALVNQSSNFNTILTYIGQRASYILSVLPPPVTFAITTNNGQDFTVNTASTVLEGNGWIDIRSIVIAERGEELQLSWPTNSRWRAVVDLDGGPNRLTLVAEGFGGAQAGSDVITVTSTFGWPRPSITAISPAAARPGAKVTVSGRNFQNGIQVFFGGTPASNVVFNPAVNPGALEATVPALPPGEVQVTVRNTDGRTSAGVNFTVLPSFPIFIRGDANFDAQLDIADPVRILLHLFAGAEITCLDAADADDDEALAIADAVTLLNYLFLRGPAPRPPFPAPGPDPAGQPLDCDRGL